MQPFALPPAAPRPPFPLLTVCYLADLPLLQLQARSFARHLAYEEGRRILVVDNETEGDDFARAFHRVVLPEYGPHADQVTLLSWRELVPGHEALRGSQRQHLVKWAVAGIAESTAYLALDAKNCLLRPWRDADFLGTTGRLRLAKRRLSAALTPSYRYFMPEDPPPPYVAKVTTPYPLVTRQVQAMMAAIAAREGRPALDVLARRKDLSYLGLYWSYVVASDLEWLYDFDQPPMAAGFWGTESEDGHAILDMVRRHEVPWLGIHRRVGRVAANIRAGIAEIVAAAGLFETTADAKLFLRRLSSRSRARQMAEGADEGEAEGS